MNQNPATPNIETRAIADSISMGHRLMSEAETALGALTTAVTGYGAEATDAGPTPSGGLVRDADNLASRLQSFVSDLHRVSARITAPNVKSLAVGSGGGPVGYADSPLARGALG